MRMEANGEGISAAVATTVARLRARPDKTRSSDRPAIAVIEAGLRCRIDGPGGWSVSTDMPASVGGAGGAPSPGWLLRAAQAACLATMVALRAAQESIALDELIVTVDSESDARGMLGMDDAVPPGPLLSRARVRLASGQASPVQLREIVTWARAHAPVSDAVGRAVPTILEIEIP